MSDWMLPAVILASLGIPALVFAPLILGLITNSARKKRLRLHGQLTRVEILCIRDTRVTVNLNPQVELSVRMPYGSIGKFKMFVSRVNFPRPGETIEVLYDPSDPSVVLTAKS
jgi:hypothetical protein